MTWLHASLSDVDTGAPQGGTSVLERTETETQRSPGDGERYAHYVRKEKITASAVTGQAVIALCGKVWVPMRDPKNFPVCPTCKEIMKSLGDGAGQPGWPFNSGSSGPGR
ncbi:MAG: DUF3039 domain-containing protein [Actinomycetaceae bacterium]|nr:DUF3039 domain-containing protein [Actinomycetaceae bacterium]